MITTYILVALSVLAVASFVIFARIGGIEVGSEEDLEERTMPVDPEIVANLFDPEQIAYVRSRLTPREFALYEKERTWVLIEYVQRISRNSALLVGFAHSHSASHPGGISGDLYSLALRLRVKSLWVLFLLHIHTLWPSKTISVGSLFASYQQALNALPNRAVKTT